MNTTHKIVAGSYSPWIDVNSLKTDSSLDSILRPKSSKPSQDASDAKTIPTTNNEIKTTSHNNEAPLQQRMEGLSITTLTAIDTKSSIYQEHVCAEDFYKQPRRVYENVVVVAKGTVEVETSEGEKPGEQRKASNSWRFESEVSWNEGGAGNRPKSGYYETVGRGSVKSVENQGAIVGLTRRSTGYETGAVPPPGRTESQSMGQMKQAEPSQVSRAEPENNGQGHSLETKKPSVRAGTTTGSRTALFSGFRKPQTMESQNTGGQSTPGSRKSESPLDQSPTVEILDPIPVAKEPIPPSSNKKHSPTINSEAQGIEIRRKIQSDNGGWKYAFELFELGKVPDTIGFVIDVLEEFMNRRPLYWERLRSQGFDVQEYRNSDDDDLFLQISFTNSTIEAIKRGDIERAKGLIENAFPPLQRRRPKTRSWILKMEAVEMTLYFFYICLKLFKLPGSKGPDPTELVRDPDEMRLDDEVSLAVTSAERTPEGLKWHFQFYFLVTMLLKVDNRYSHSTKWIQWTMKFQENRKEMAEVMKIANDMQGVEALRYAVEKAAAGSMSGWNDRVEVKGLSGVSLEYLSWFASLGHKEAVLKNLETLYDLGTVIGWDAKTPKKPTAPAKLATVSEFRQPLVQSLIERPAIERPPIERPPGRQFSRTGSIRHPSPWESGLPSSSKQPPNLGVTSRSIPEQTTPKSTDFPAFSQPQSRRSSEYDPRKWAPEPLAESSPPPKTYKQEEKEQRHLNLLGQPVRLADDCEVHELDAIMEYKQAIRSTPNLDIYIGTLASLRLINFISGNPEYKPWTPLIEAICNQRWDAAKALVRLGAAFNIGYPFHTALSRHTAGGSPARCAALAAKKLIDLNNLSPEAYFYRESTNFIYYMIECGAELNALGAANTDLGTQIKTYPLHLAALDAMPTTNMVIKMIQLGANVWSMDSNGDLAIDYARRTGNTAVIAQLEKAMSAS